MKPKVQKLFHQSGSVKEIGAFEDNVREGLTATYYDPHGIKSEYFYKNGKAEGVCREYHRTGELCAEMNFRDGKLNGITKRYYKSGRLQATLHYKNGKLDGTCRVFYQSGVLQKIGTFKAGKQVGDAGVYYETGIFKRKGLFFDDEDRRTEIVYEKGKKTESLDLHIHFFAGIILVILLGASIYMFSPYSPLFRKHESKTIREEILEIQEEKPLVPPKDPPDGVFKTYYESGELYTLSTFVDGKRNGITRKFYKTGRVQAEITYQDDLLHGRSRIYHESGRLVSESFYEMGKLVRGRDEKSVKKTQVEVPQEGKAEKIPFIMKVDQDGGDSGTVRYPVAEEQ